MKRRDRGNGGMDMRGENSWRLRYYINGKRFTKSFHGTKQEASKELRRLLTSGDTGTHVPPARSTLGDWAEEWLALRARDVTAGTIEHYSNLLRVHILPTLGQCRLQEISPTEIDRLYSELRKHLSARSVHHVHVVLTSCLKTAVKKRKLHDNPAARADVPKAKESDAWNVLDADQLITLVRGFKGTALYGIVAVCAFGGLRRNEALALQWRDIDFAKSTITISRSVEKTKRNGLTFKPPKTERGKRVIHVDATLLNILRTEHERHLSIVAGIPSGTEVDLSLMRLRLPTDALVFPSPVSPFDLTRLRDPTAVTKDFVRRAAALGFPIRLHDLRHSHGTILLSKGSPIHEVAGRLGHSAAILLKTYAHRLPELDKQAAEIMGKISSGLL